MTPDEKEQLVLALKDSGRTCMMCGDGANDVGALKQAQVRLILSRLVKYGVPQISDVLLYPTCVFGAAFC